MIQFTLNDKEERAAKKFIKSFMSRQKMAEKPLGKIIYIISPTGIGDNIKIKFEDGEELDITDYSSW